MQTTWLKSLAGHRGWANVGFLLVIGFDCLLRSAEAASLRTRRWRNVRTCRIYVDVAIQNAAALKPISEKLLKATASKLDSFLS